MGTVRNIAGIAACTAGIALAIAGCIALKRHLDRDGGPDGADIPADGDGRPDEDGDAVTTTVIPFERTASTSISSSIPGPPDEPGEVSKMDEDETDILEGHPDDGIPKEKAPNRPPIQYIIQDDAGKEGHDVINMTWYEPDKVMVEDISFEEIDDLGTTFLNCMWQEAFGLDPEDPDIACIRNNVTDVDYVVCRTSEHYKVD